MYTIKDITKYPKSSRDIVAKLMIAKEIHELNKTLKKMLVQIKKE